MIYSTLSIIFVSDHFWRYMWVFCLFFYSSSVSIYLLRFLFFSLTKISGILIQLKLFRPINMSHLSVPIKEMWSYVSLYVYTTVLFLTKVRQEQLFHPCWSLAETLMCVNCLCFSQGWSAEYLFFTLCFSFLINLISLKHLN